jgi:hypothetical protein
LLRRLFRRLATATLAWFADLFLDKAFLAALHELILSDFAVIVGVDHLEVDNEGGGLVLRENIALALGQAPSRFAFSLIENCPWTA